MKSVSLANPLPLTFKTAFEYEGLKGVMATIHISTYKIFLLSLIQSENIISPVFII